MQLFEKNQTEETDQLIYHPVSSRFSAISFVLLLKTGVLFYDGKWQHPAAESLKV